VLRGELDRYPGEPSWRSREEAILDHAIRKAGWRV